MILLSPVRLRTPFCHSTTHSFFVIPEGNLLEFVWIPLHVVAIVVAYLQLTSRLFPSPAAIDGLPARAISGFYDTLLKVLKTYMSNDSCEAILYRQLFAMPRRALVSGVAKTQLLSTQPYIATGHGDDPYPYALIGQDSSPRPIAQGSLRMSRCIDSPMRPASRLAISGSRLGSGKARHRRGTPTSGRVGLCRVWLVSSNALDCNLWRLLEQPVILSPSKVNQRRRTDQNHRRHCGQPGKPAPRRRPSRHNVQHGCGRRRNRQAKDVPALTASREVFHHALPLAFQERTFRKRGQHIFVRMGQRPLHPGKFHSQRVGFSLSHS